MPNDHFDISYVISFYRIIWKIIVKYLKKHMIIFYRDPVMDFTLL